MEGPNLQTAQNPPIARRTLLVKEIASAVFMTRRLLARSPAPSAFAMNAIAL